jgi:hypothetical protein
VTHRATPEHRLDDRRLDAYLDRIGAGRRARPDAASLAELQLHHLRTVPFENLSIHLGEPIVLEPAALVDKLVDRRSTGSSPAPGDAEVLDTYRTWFGIVLDHLPSPRTPGSRPG